MNNYSVKLFYYGSYLKHLNWLSLDKVKTINTNSDKRKFSVSATILQNQYAHLHRLYRVALNPEPVHRESKIVKYFAKQHKTLKYDGNFTYDLTKNLLPSFTANKLLKISQHLARLYRRHRSGNFFHSVVRGSMLSCHPIKLSER